MVVKMKLTFFHNASEDNQVQAGIEAAIEKDKWIEEGRRTQNIGTSGQKKTVVNFTGN